MKKLVLVLVVFIALVTTAYFWFKAYTTVRNPYDAVPEHAAMVLDIPATGQFLKQLSQQTNYAVALETMDFYQRAKHEMLSLDSLASFENSAFSSSLELAPSLVLMLETADGFGFVYVLTVANQLKMYQLSYAATAVFGNRLAVVERKFAGYNTATIVDKQKTKQLNYCITGGLLVLSYNRQAFETTLSQLDKKEGLLNDAGFARVKATTGKQSNAFLFMNFSRAEKLFQENAAETYLENATALGKAAGSWAAFDLSLKADQLMLNGFLRPDEASFIHSVMTHEADTAGLFSLIPYDARLFVHFSMKELRSFFASITDSAKIQALSAHAGIDIEHMLLAKIGNEAVVGYRQGDKTTKAFALIALEDAAPVAQNLANMSQALAGTEVRTMNGALLANLMPLLFGEAFAAIDRLHYQIEDDKLFAANNVTTVEQLVALHQKGRGIGNTERFKTFSNHLSPLSNILVYGNLREGLDLINSFTGPELGYHINRNRQALTTFNAVALQLTASPPFLYTNIVADFQPGVAEQGSVAWQTALEADVAGAVSLVESGKTEPAMLTAFDSRNQMYLINHEGNILWKKQLQSPVVSSVTTIFRSKTRQPYMLFNTTGHIHLVDTKGKDAPGFPIRLKAQATNPLSVSGSGADDYQILVSCSDKITYSFNLSGNETKGWNFPKAQDIITKPVAQLGAGKLSYVVIEDASGSLRITDKSGKQRITPKGMAEKAPNAVVSLNRTNSKGVLITTDKSGKLLYISGSGNTSTTDFGEWSGEHYFLYDDFSQNRSDDFIFLDKEKLVILDRFKKLLFEYTFSNEISSSPYFVKLPGNQRMLCVTDEIAREVYLIDKHGRMLTASGLAGDTPLRPVSFDEGGDIFLITGSARNLICYQLY